MILIDDRTFVRHRDRVTNHGYGMLVLKVSKDDRFLCAIPGEPAQWFNFEDLEFVDEEVSLS